MPSWFSPSCAGRSSGRRHSSNVLTSTSGASVAMASPPHKSDEASPPSFRSSLNEKNRNLVVRVVSAVVLLPAVLFLLLKGGWYSCALMGVAGAICTAEYYAITQRQRSAVLILSVLAPFPPPPLPLLSPRHAA